MKIASEVNPRGQAVKSTEMTVRRALAIVKVFDNLPKEAKDWSDAEPKELRKALGTDTFDPHQAVLPELWKRYRDRSLHQQILDLVESLDLSKLSKTSQKEIKSGIAKISKR